MKKIVKYVQNKSKIKIISYQWEKMTWKYKNFPKLFIIKKFYIKINAFQFC